MAALGTGLVFAFAGRGVLAFVAPFALAAAFVAGRSLGRGARTAAALGMAAIAVAALGATAVAARPRELPAARANDRRRPASAAVPGRLGGVALGPQLDTERSLVFTSLTGHVLREADTSVGPETAADGDGWNYYPMTGRRQLYIAGWINGDYRDDADGLTARLSSNDAVLAGRSRPCDVPEAGSYAPYYVVLERSQRPPPRARLLHENSALAVYRLGGCGL